MTREMALRVLMVEDVEDDALLAEEVLRQGGYTVSAQRVDTAATLDAALTGQTWDLILCDYSMPHFNGLEALALVRQRGLDLPFILLSGTIGEEVAVAALQAGADDYIMKGNPARLVPSVQHALREVAERQQRRQAEEALRASEALYRSLVETSPDAIALLDLQGRIQMANQQAATLYHHPSPAALLGQTALELLAPDDRARASAALSAVAASAVPDTHTYTAQRQDGTTFSLELQATRVHAAGRGATDSIMLIGRDITERTQAAEHLRFQAHLLETVGQAVVATDVAGVITYWNRAAEALYGWAATEVVGRHILAILPMEPFRARDAETLASLGGGAPASGEYRARHRSGRMIPILATAVPVHDDGGVVVGIIGVSTDITARKQAEEATALLAAIVASSDDAIIGKTLDGTILSWNQGAATMYGYTAGEMVGRPIALLVPPDRPDEVPRLLDRLRRGDTINHYESVRTRKDGQPLAVSVTISPIRDAQGLIVAAATIARDITHQKEAEAAIGRHLASLSALRAIDVAIMGSVDHTRALALILERAMSLLAVDAALVLTLNPHLHVLEYAASRGFHSDAVRDLRLALGEGHAGRAALERRPIRVANLATEPPAQAHLLTAEGFVGYWAVPLLAKGEVKGVLILLHRAPLDLDQDKHDLLDGLAGQTAIALDNADLFTNLQRSNTELRLAYDATIAGWSRALDLRDKETEGHSQRVTTMTLRLAHVMGLSSAALVQVRRGALLHDIGKMGVPDAILLKPGPLTADEWVVMRRHPANAYALLSPIAYLQPALDIPYCHHEKWDGTGYPRGLQGAQIPLSARIFAVADVADALLADRPYRAAWSREQVCTHISSLSGSHFDPAVVAAFLGLAEEDSG